MEIYCSTKPSYVHREMNYKCNDDDDDMDDVFYAELRRQILLLTAEDEEEELNEYENKNSVKVTKGCAFNGASPVVKPSCFFNWSGDEKTDLVPSWLTDLWNTGNGTGVFIPYIVKSRRRYMPRRKKNERGREYKPVMNN